MTRCSSHAPVAQLDRASVYGTEGQRFESSRARLRNPRKHGGFLRYGAGREALERRGVPLRSTKRGRFCRRLGWIGWLARAERRAGSLTA